MRRPVAVAVAAVATVALLGGCSSEEPPPLGADGSGTFRTAEQATATLVDDAGEVVGRAEAEADVSDTLELSLQVPGLDPGSYRVVLVPGATCEGRAKGGPRGPRLPDVVVEEDRSASYVESTGLSLDDLDDGAALRLVGGGTRACGILADH